MAGIYVHIPFCRKACHYCNFHFSTNLSRISDLATKICDELHVRSEELSSQSIETIYFGGGTPSVLSPQDLRQILTTIREHYPVVDQMEVTLETNPEDINPMILSEWYAMGVNRLSIGIQSFLEKDLQYMNRAHSAGQSLQALQDINASEFTNVTADLMFGLIDSTMAEWKDNIEQMCSFDIPHLSLYNLTIEEQTVFAHRLKKQQLNTVDEDLQRRQFYIASELLQSKGYEHYEISNYALAGHQAVHNTSYWDRVPYMGVGPSAHSLIGDVRSWNIANNALYLKDDFENREQEILTEQDIYNEVIMLGLRRRQGVLDRVVGEFSQEIVDHFETAVAPLVESGVLLREESTLILPKEQWYVCDAVAAELFI